MKTPTLASRMLCGASLVLFSACNNGAENGAAETSHHHDTNHSMSHDASNHTTENTPMMQSMSSMMDKMHSMKMNGDPDRDFAEMMIVHHQGAVDMAKAELASGKDAAIRDMATGIISAQENEIAEMRRIVSSLPAPAANTDVDLASDPLMKSMSGMMEAGHSAQSTGDVDKDFVQMMIPHHEGAVAMASVQLQQGRNAELKRMAQKMIDDQTREIGQFKQWLASHPQAASLIAMNAYATPLFASVFFAAYMLVAFVWPSVRIARATGVNPVMLGRGDDVYDYIGRCFKAVLALVPLVIACAWFPRVYFYLGTLLYLLHPAIQYTGVALCLLSLLWTVIAQAQMGRSWRIGIDRERETELVRSGLFRMSRNPIFLGMIVTLAGFFLLLPNAVSLVAALSGYLLIQIQIRLEEAHLAAMHGDAYSNYRKTTRRLL